MTLLWIPLLSLIGSVISAFTGKLTRNQATSLTMLAPLIALCITLYHAPAVLAGETIRFSAAWNPKFRARFLPALRRSKFTVYIYDFGHRLIGYFIFSLLFK